MEALKRSWIKLHENHPNWMGRFYALMTAVAITMMTIFVKLIRKEVHFLVIMPLQATIGATTSFVIFGFMGQSLHHTDKEVTFKLFLRGLFGSTFYMIYHLAIRVLPPQKFVVLSNTLPIFVVILAAFLLDERPTGVVIGLLVVGMLGIIIMVDPVMILPSSWVDASQYVAAVQDYPVYYYLLPILTAFAGAAISIFLKALAGKINAFHNAGYFFIFAGIYCGIASLMVEIPQAARELTIGDYVGIAGSGIAQALHQIFLSLASTYESKASYISMLTSAQMPLTYLFDVLILGGKLELLDVIGATLVMSTTVLIAVSKEKQPPK